MARQESDREDLMREAVALVRRAEVTYPGRSPEDPVTLGFRREGSLAIYFGADPVYQFDPRHRLRRAYAAGQLYRTQGRTLARLTRERTPKETVLLRHDLEPDELEAFLRAARNQLTELRLAIEGNAAQVLAQIPSEGNLLPEVETFLAEILRQDIPLAPAIPGKR
jgi:hypothetical protein